MIEQLQELGLSKTEARVYLTLLELGSTTTGPIIKKSGMYRVMVYDTLEKLLQRGLVTYSIQKNRKHFQAEDPELILKSLQQKEALAQTLMKKLRTLRIEQLPEQGASVYEGWKGIKAAQENYFKIMKKGSSGEYLMVGASRQLHQKLEVFFNDFHERRSKLKIPAKLLFNENNRKFGKVKQKFKPVQIRFMPKKIVTPSWISTYQNMVLIGVAEELPMAFFIQNKAVAESYRQYFYFMWNQSKP